MAKKASRKPKAVAEPVGLQTICGAVSVVPVESMLEFTCACGQGKCWQVASAYQGLPRQDEHLRAWMAARHED